MKSEDEKLREEKKEQIKEQFQKLFALKGYKQKDNFTSDVWFLKNDAMFQSLINSSTPMSNELISKKIMDIFSSLNKSNSLKNLTINVEDFINEVTNKIMEADSAVQKSKNNIQQNKTLEKIAKLNEILQILSQKIESSANSNYNSTFRANIHSLKNFPKGNYKINLSFNNNFSKEEEKEMNGTERKNMNEKIDELSNLFENKKISTNKIIEIPNNYDEIIFRSQKNSYNKDNNLQEPNSFPEYKFTSLKKEGCKYILDRRYSGSTLSNFQIELIQNGDKIYRTKNEFFFLYVLNYLFDDFCNINKDTISFQCCLKAFENGLFESDNMGEIDLEVILELDPITRAELLNRIREVYSLTVDTKEDNANFIKEILTDYFIDIKDQVEAILNYDGIRDENCCNPCLII